jgi:hypothetical protein
MAVGAPGLLKTLGIGAVAGALLVAGIPGWPAWADPPNCVTGLKGQPRDGIRSQVQQYLDANPQTRAEI